MTRALHVSIVCLGVVLGALVAPAAEAPAPKPAEPAPKPLPASYYAELARVNHSYRQLDEAVRLYQKALELETDKTRRAGYAGALAEIYVAQKKHEAALPLLREAIQASASRTIKARYRMLLAQIAEQSDDLAAAEAAYKEAAASAEHEFERSAALRKLLLLYKRMKKLDQVLADTEKRVAANPKDIEAIDLLAIAYSSVQRDPAKALDTLAKLAEARPEPATLRRLATALQNANRHADAIAVYETLLEKDAQNRAYYCERISQLHAAAGDKEKAIAWARKIAADSPDNVYAVTRLASLLVRLGHAKEGIAEYERAASLAKTPAERERTLLACAQAARTAKLYEKAETILRGVARDSKVAANRVQAKKALFQLYEELNKLDQLQIKTKDEKKKP